MKFIVTLSQIDYRSLLDWIGEMQEKNPSHQDGFSALVQKFAGSSAVRNAASQFLDAFSEEDKNRYVVKMINGSKPILIRKITGLMAENGILVTVEDVTAEEISGTVPGMALTVTMQHLDIGSVVNAMVPGVHRHLAESERLRFLADLLTDQPDIVSAGVKAALSRIPESRQEQLIAEGIRSYREPLMDLITALLQKNHLHITVSSLTVVV